MNSFGIQGIQWKKLLITFAFWAIAEVYLSIIGLDDYIDYGEFIFAVQEASLFLHKKARYQPARVERKTLLLPISLPDPTREKSHTADKIVI